MNLSEFIKQQLNETETILIKKYKDHLTLSTIQNEYYIGIKDFETLQFDEPILLVDEEDKESD